jgi:histidine triad (HIT) family protein
VIVTTWTTAESGSGRHADRAHETHHHEIAGDMARGGPARFSPDSAKRPGFRSRHAEHEDERRASNCTSVERLIGLGLLPPSVASVAGVLNGRADGFGKIQLRPSGIFICSAADCRQDRGLSITVERAMAEAYDQNNIFAKILRGEAPCIKVFESEAALAFMDIMPRADGHVLVIPKVPARNILDISAEELARFAPAVQKVAIGVKAAMQADGLTIQQFNESAGGQIVFHLHVHILPRWAGVALRPPGGPIVGAEALAPFAAKIAAAIGGG